jgi:hypothetical protein
MPRRGAKRTGGSRTVGVLGNPSKKATRSNTTAGATRRFQVATHGITRRAVLNLQGVYSEYRGIVASMPENIS